MQKQLFKGKTFLCRSNIHKALLWKMGVLFFFLSFESGFILFFSRDTFLRLERVLMGRCWYSLIVYVNTFFFPLLVLIESLLFLFLRVFFHLMLRARPILHIIKPPTPQTQPSSSPSRSHNIDTPSHPTSALTPTPHPSPTHHHSPRSPAHQTRNALYKPLLQNRTHFSKASRFTAISHRFCAAIEIPRYGQPQKTNLAVR